MGKTLRKLVESKLVRLAGAAVITAVSWMPMNKAEGGMIQISNGFYVTPGVVAPNVILYNYPGYGATDGFDQDLDGEYNPYPKTPVVDFFSVIPGYNLSEDVRDSNSTTTFYTRMQGRGLTSPIWGNLMFWVGDVNDFKTKAYADIYKNNQLIWGDIDVNDFFKNKTPIPLTLNSDTDFYNINVKFTDRPLAELTGDDVVNFADFSVMTNDWDKTGAGLKGDITGPNGFPDRKVDYYDLDYLVQDWLN